MGAENSDGSRWYLVDLVNEASALVLQVFDNVLIVNNLMADKNRGVLSSQAHARQSKWRGPLLRRTHEVEPARSACYLHRERVLHFGHPV